MLNVGDVRNKTHIQIIEKKTGKFKKFPINAKLKPMFEEFTKGKRSDEPLFTTLFKNRLDRFWAYYILKTACKAVKLEEKIGTHTLRKRVHYFNELFLLFENIYTMQQLYNMLLQLPEEFAGSRVSQSLNHAYVQAMPHR